MSAYTQGLQNANDAFEAFVDGEIHAGSIASDTGVGTVTTATLGFTPDWVVFSFENGTLDSGEAKWSTTTTTLTITGRSTTTAGTISYIAGNLS